MQLCCIQVQQITFNTGRSLSASIHTRSCSNKMYFVTNHVLKLLNYRQSYSHRQDETKMTKTQTKWGAGKKTVKSGIKQTITFFSKFFLNYNVKCDCLSSDLWFSIFFKALNNKYNWYLRHLLWLGLGLDAFRMLYYAK